MVDQLRGHEPLAPQEGIQIHFVSPELLRAYILEPNKPGRVSFAERKAGVREIQLADFSLDGGMFESARISLLIEPAPNWGIRAPSVIIRADLELGSDPSALKLLQDARRELHESEEEDDPQEDDALRTTCKDILPENLLQWTANTARMFSRQPGTAPDQESDPLALLQVWEQDAGPGSVSISLFTRGRYERAWEINRNAYDKLRKNGLEASFDSCDAWNFSLPVGVSTHDPDRFQQAIEFYEQAFSALIGALYTTEGKPTPNADFEIESPSILPGDKLAAFSDICGQVEAVEFLQSLAQSEKLRRKLARRPLVLLAGPPGNGKTSLVQATANAIEAPLLVASTRSLPPEADDSQYLDLLEAGYLQAKAAAKMREGKAVYCIEGLEAMLGSSLRHQDRFMNMMEAWATDPDNDVLVTATTNFPGNLHPAIVSRFHKFDILPPKHRDVMGIMTVLAEKLGKQTGRSDILGDVDLALVAAKLEAAGYSGRDILKFLTSAYYTRRQESEEVGHWLPMDTEFLLKHAPKVRSILDPFRPGV